MSALGRLAWFILLFSILPALGAVSASLGGSSRLELLIEPLKAAPQFALVSTLKPLASSLTFATLLAIASFWAFPLGARFSWFRAFRAFAIFCVIIAVLHPSFCALIPVIRALPVWLVGVISFVSASILCVIPKVRITWREAALISVGSFVFLYSPEGRISREDFARLAGRELTEQDIVIFGVDSISYPDVADVLRTFSTPGAAKVVFEDATTPMAATNTAWRTILSGFYPRGDVLPAEPWGHEAETWIPDELKRAGYTVTLMQDDPTSNVFSQDENVEIATNQGWKWMLETFMWRTVFPLSEVSGPFWVSAFGGPSHSASRYAYDPDRYVNSWLRHLAVKSRGGRVFAASHSCFVHTPIHLTLREVLSINLWWKKRPVDFNGGVSYFTKSESGNYKEVLDIRLKSAGLSLERTLGKLSTTGVIGGAMVFVLSDHGPRASWVTRRGVHHIILTCFKPGTGSSLVKSPVSLVDIAPTVRSFLGFEAKPSDGTPLPFTSAAGGLRETRQVTPPSVQIGAKALFDPRNLGFRGNVDFHRDGTFGMSELLKSEIRSVIERESRSLNALNTLLGERVPDEGAPSTHP